MLVGDLLRAFREAKKLSQGDIHSCNKVITLDLPLFNCPLCIPDFPTGYQPHLVLDLGRVFAA